MKLFQTSNKWEKWWQNRKIDWAKEYLSTWDHPHRMLIVAALGNLKGWMSLMELGCGAGANLVAILKAGMKDKQLGGVDINPEAIELCRNTFKGGVFKVSPADNLMISDSSTDVVLTDMCLIYYGPRKIHKALEEIKRVARAYVVFCEFHHHSYWKRLQLRLTSGYYAHDYRKILEEHGYSDVELYKIPEEYWPGGNPQKTFGYLIKARVPRRK